VKSGNEATAAEASEQKAPGKRHSCHGDSRRAQGVIKTVCLKGMSAGKNCSYATDFPKTGEDSNRCLKKKVLKKKKKKTDTVLGRKRSTEDGFLPLSIGKKERGGGTRTLAKNGESRRGGTSRTQRQRRALGRKGRTGGETGDLNWIRNVQWHLNGRGRCR